MHAVLAVGVQCPSCKRAWNVEGELPSALVLYFCSPLRCGFCSHPRMVTSLPQPHHQRTLLSPTDFYHHHTLPEQLPTPEQLQFLLLPAQGEFLVFPSCAVLKKLHFPTHTLVFGVHPQGAVVVKCHPRSLSSSLTR